MGGYGISIGYLTSDSADGWILVAPGPTGRSQSSRILVGADARRQVSGQRLPIVVTIRTPTVACRQTPDVSHVPSSVRRVARVSVRQHASASRCTIFVPDRENLPEHGHRFDAAPCHHVPRDREVGRPSQQAPEPSRRETDTDEPHGRGLVLAEFRRVERFDPRTPAPAGNSFARTARSVRLSGAGRRSRASHRSSFALISRSSALSRSSRSRSSAHAAGQTGPSVPMA